MITSRTLQPVAAAMPTPRELKEALTSAECWPQLQKISDHARESCKEEMAEQAKREEHPGEGWRATKWLEMNKLADLVAQILMQPLYDLAGNAAAELSFFRAFGEMGSRDLLLALMTDGRLTELLADELWPKFVSLATPGAASASELHAKFAGEGAGFELEYASLDAFFGGLEQVVGSPNPNVTTAMRREHCNELDSREPFTTPNYKMTTTARIEWWFVEDPENGLKENRLDKWPFEDPSTISGSAVPRVPLPQKAFDLAFDEVNTNLIKLSMPTIMNSEFLGARMYTGPCFVKYNTVLRGLQVRSSTAHPKHTFLPIPLTIPSLCLVLRSRRSNSSRTVI